MINNSSKSPQWAAVFFSLMGWRARPGRPSLAVSIRLAAWLACVILMLYQPTKLANLPATGTQKNIAMGGCSWLQQVKEDYHGQP